MLREQRIFGYQKKLKERPYGYIPVSECKKWGEELKSRPDRREAMLEAAGGPKPDWQGEFLDKDPNDKGNKAVKYDDSLSREEIVGLVGVLVQEAIDKALPKGMRRARETKRQQKQDEKYAAAKTKAKLDRESKNAK
jgi:hypothetical protein